MDKQHTYPDRIISTYTIIGPVPIYQIGLVMSQVERQEWTVRFVVFAGHASVTPVLLKEPQIFPLYNVIAGKRHPESVKVPPPVINLNVKPAPQGPVSPGCADKN
jgi:hypothetical protein